MKTALITVALTVACAIQGYAADNSKTLNMDGQHIEQKRAEILQHIEQRIALSLQEKTCVQTAQTDTEFRACRDKYRPVKKNDDHSRTNSQP